jgi:hypothetical protein
MEDDNYLAVTRFKLGTGPRQYSRNRRFRRDGWQSWNAKVAISQPISLTAYIAIIFTNLQAMLTA